MKNKPSKLGDILKNITKSYIAKEAAKERTKSYDIRRIFEQMELDLISSMKRAFYFHKREEQKEGFSWEQWQLSKLRAIEKYRKQNKKLVESYSKPIQDAIDRELTGNYKNGQGKMSSILNRIKSLLNINKVKVDVPYDISEKQKIREYISTNLGKSVNIPEENSFFGVNEKKLNALQDVVKNDLKKGQYSVLSRMDDVYRQTIFKTQVYLQSGTKTINQAIDMATKDFLDKGINSITYKDGKRVNISSYAEMCLRTANQRATFLGEGSKRDEYGIHLVVVSAHANTCEKCEAWQGKVLIDDVFSHPSKEYIKENISKYKLLSEAIQSGLLHPNCRHTLATYFPGISKLPIVPDGKAAVELYESEQKQRALERQIRRWKRIEAGTCDVENQQKASERVRELENKIRDHLQEYTQLRRNYNREKPDIRSIQEINYKADLKQYDTYKEILGKEAPKTLQEFQNLKYNDSGEWNRVQTQYNDKQVVNLLNDNNIEYIEKMSEKQFIIKNYKPKLTAMTQHAKDNLMDKSDRANMTLENAQMFIDNAKVVIYESNRRTVKFISQDGYSAVNLKNELVTAVPQKWRNKYNKYVKED